MKKKKETYVLTGCIVIIIAAVVCIAIYTMSKPQTVPYQPQTTTSAGGVEGVASQTTPSVSPVVAGTTVAPTTSTLLPTPTTGIEQPTTDNVQAVTPTP